MNTIPTPRTDEVSIAYKKYNHFLSSQEIVPSNFARQLETELIQLEAQKNSAYSERNKLVSFISKIFPASLERHEGENWDDDWRWVVFIDSPMGQVSWHIHDSELPMFDRLPRNAGRKWNGHTTEEKYACLSQFKKVKNVYHVDPINLYSKDMHLLITGGASGEGFLTKETFVQMELPENASVLVVQCKNSRKNKKNKK